MLSFILIKGGKMNYDKIIVLDYGSQYNHLIARRVRELGVYSELRPHTIKYDEIKKDPQIKGIILSGGPNSVYDKGAFDINIDIINSGIPILGICYGMQLLNYKLGAKVVNSDHHEYGKKEVNVINDNSLLLKGIPNSFNVLMSHGDRVESIPVGFVTNANSTACPNAIISNDLLKLYGVQFHPEVRNTEYGIDILRNFAINICEANPNWSMTSYIDDQVKAIREFVGDRHVLCGLSGGVDSSVVAALVHRAIGDQLMCMFIDHGLLRKNEYLEVLDTFTNNFNINVIGISIKYFKVFILS